MSRKLSEDQIRWILDLDAKGVQGTLAQVTSSTHNLQKANRELSDAIRATEKEMAAMEKQLIKLEKAGKQNSSEYKKLASQIADSKQSNAEFRREIAQNDKTIADNNKKFIELEKSMALSDMTMEQLRRRADSLRKQLDVTSRSASPDAYESISAELQQTNKAMDDIRSSGKSLSDILNNLPGPAAGAAKSVKSVGTALKALIANPIGAVIMAIVVAFELLKTVIDTNAAASVKFQGATAALSSVLDSTKRIVTEVVAALYNFVTLDWEGLKQNITNLGDQTTALLDNASAAYQAAEAEYALNLQLQDNSAKMQTNQAEIERLRTISQDITLSYDKRKEALESLATLEDENYRLSLNNITETYNVWKEKNANVISEIESSSAAQFKAVEDYISLIQSGNELTFEQQKNLDSHISQIAHNLRNTSTELRDEFRAMFTDLSAQQRDHYRKSREDANRDATLRKQQAQKAFDDAKKRLDNEQKSTITSINNDLNSLLITETQATIRRLEVERGFLEQKRELYIKHGKDTADIEVQISENTRKVNEARFADELAVQNKHYHNEQQALKQQLANRVLTQEQYDNQAATLKADYYNSVIAINKKYNQDTSALEASALDHRLRMQQQYANNVLRTAANTREAYLAAIQASYDTESYALQRQLDKKEVGQREFDRRMLELDAKTADARLRTLKESQKALQVMADKNIPGAAQALQDLSRDIANAEVELARATQNAADAGINIFTQLADAMDGIAAPDFFLPIIDSATTMCDEIDKLLNDSNRSWDDYATAILSCLSAAMKSVAAITEQMFERETAALEAEKQKQLSIAGDNVDAREAIEAEYAQKELDLRKKQASANAAIQSAQLWIDTAMGVVSAWTSCMQLGPIAGPIVAGILTAGLLALAGIQQDAILKNRDAILNTTLESASPSSSTSTPDIPDVGNIALKEGYADGGYTGAGGKYDIAGYLPDGSPFHRGEYFVAQEEMSNPTVVPFIRAIEAVRRRRTSRNPLPADYGIENSGGYADGGFHPHNNNNNNNMLSEVLHSLLRIIRDLRDNPIRAELNYYQFERTSSNVNNYRKYTLKR